MKPTADKETATERFSVNVTKTKKTALDAASKAEGRTLSSLANRAFDLYLKRGRKAS